MYGGSLPGIILCRGKEENRTCAEGFRLALKGGLGHSMPFQSLTPLNPSAHVRQDGRRYR